MKKLLSFALSLVCIIGLVSCGQLDSQKAHDIAVPLIEASQKLDLVLYGTGLPVTDEKNGKYTKVDSADYTCLDDIKAEMNEIYTPELAEIIRNSALKGSTSEHGTTYARYIDIDGALYSYDGAKVYVPHARRYDLDSIRATNMTDRRIIFTVDTYTADEDGTYSDTPVNIELKLIYDDAYEKWLLDTPTY